MYDVAHLVALANMCRTSCLCLRLTLEIICACSYRFVLYTYLLQALLLYLLLYYLTSQSAIAHREVLLRRWRSARRRRRRAHGMIDDVKIPHRQLNLTCIQVLVLSLLPLLVLKYLLY
jgi:hypothetical protein